MTRTPSRSQLAAAAAAAAGTVGAALCAALVPGPAVAAAAPAPPSRDVTRMNNVQVIGTHNGYHRELPEDEKAVQLAQNPAAIDLFYSHASLRSQLAGQDVRNIELDVVPDPAGGLYAHPLVRKLAGKGPLTDPAWQRPGTKVFHIVDFDYGTTCVTLVACLTQVKNWSDANPHHVPVSIMLEFKQSEDRLEQAGGVQSPPWDSNNLAALDAEIRSVFADEDLVTPDDVRKGRLTLEQSVLRRGWPSLAQSRGKVAFFMDNDAGTPVSDAYVAGHPSLKGRPVFTNSLPGRADAAFIKRNDPRGTNTAQIQDLVRRGYYVRTRADIPISTVTSGDTSMRDAALLSGAQIVSTDFPAVGMAARYDSDYVAMLPGGVPARCNPVATSSSCRTWRLHG